MGGYVNNGIFWSLTSDKDFTEETLLYWETNIESLSRIQIDANRLNKISKENLLIIYHRIFSKNKNLNFRIYSGTTLDVSFLEIFVDLENISIEVSNKIENIEALAKLENLTELYLQFDNQENLEFLNKINLNLKKISICNYNKIKTNLDLMPILRFKELEHLSLTGYSKNIDIVVPKLLKINTLALRSIPKLQNINFINTLKDLKSLIIQLCPIDDLKVLIEMNNIHYLQLWKLLKLKNLDFVSEMKNLQFIYIETLNDVVKFPKISNLKKLKRIQITSCKNLVDFSEIEKSDSLTDFIIQNASNDNINDFIPIFKNKKIKDLGIGYKKLSTQKEISNLANTYNKEIKTYMYPMFEDKFYFINV